MSNQLLKVKFIQQKNGGQRIIRVTASQQLLMVAVKQLIAQLAVVLVDFAWTGSSEHRGSLGVFCFQEIRP